MKKLSLKVVAFVVVGMISLGNLMVFAQAQAQPGGGGQNNPSGFYDPSGAGGVSVGGGTGVNAGSTLIDVIRTFVNWMLGLLALIALIILIRGGFQMVTAAGDETKYKKGFKILQQAAIGLVFIGVSRLVVSLIFRVLQTVLNIQ